MSVDISTLSAVELAALRSQIDKTIDKRRKEDLSSTRTEVAKLIASRGFSLKEVLRGMTTDQKFVRGKKYRSATDPSLVWECTGSRPMWVRNAIEAGDALIEVTD